MREEILKLHNQLFEECEKDGITIVSVIGSFGENLEVIKAQVLTGGDTQLLIPVLMYKNLELAEIIFESASKSGLGILNTLKLMHNEDTPSQS